MCPACGGKTFGGLLCDECFFSPYVCRKHDVRFLSAICPECWEEDENYDDAFERRAELEKLNGL